ncbi:aminopeptidase P family protein [Roseovarius spongiae]|uniref:Aminopeptidase P family protein n=1 Tax=Roseovarius spongiae TaxID=2320272 RepID=A0A3A8B919_9RHOB|nr:Xaa-Pro peptidase family protein [Roseovarius spongiae]RKF14176.1 aminopeptidase P family protein [Roseovarius spongiae]
MAPAFPKNEYTSRQDRFRKELERADLDLCVVTAPENVCYLTGHATPGYYTYQALVFPANGDPVLIMRESELINAEESTWFKADQLTGYRDELDPIEVTAQVIRAAGKAERIGFDSRSWFLPPAPYQKLLEEVKPQETASIDAALGRLRLVKSAAEIESIRGAARIVNHAARAAVEAIAPGVRERDVAAVMFDQMVREGSEFLGMEPFVASGPRSGNIHATWTDREIRNGEPVLIELAATRNRYHAVLMHTAQVGRLPDDLQQVADACARARDATIAAMQPGASAQSCHEACVGAIDADGLMEYYRKRTGYSVGIAFAPDWGEGGLLSLGYGETTPLEPGMVMHAVPAIRIPGRGGVGLSATVLITEDGPEVLTRIDAP